MDHGRRTISTALAGRDRVVTGAGQISAVEAVMVHGPWSAVEALRP